MPMDKNFKDNSEITPSIEEPLKKRTVPPTQENLEMAKKMDTESIEWKGKFNMKEILSTMSFTEKENLDYSPKT